MATPDCRCKLTRVSPPCPQCCEDKQIVEDDIVTDACYDLRSETIITTRKHVRDGVINPFVIKPHNPKP